MKESKLKTLAQSEGFFFLFLFLTRPWCNVLDKEDNEGGHHVINNATTTTTSTRTINDNSIKAFHDHINIQCIGKYNPNRLFV